MKISFISQQYFQTYEIQFFVVPISLKTILQFVSLDFNIIKMTAEIFTSDKIIIPFNYKGIRLNRFLAIAFIVISAIGFFNSPNNYIFNYGYLLIGSVYFYLYFFIYSKAGLLIKDGIIKVKPLGKKVVISEIVEFKKFAGDYTLITPNSKLVINTQLLDAEGLRQLDIVLENIPADFKTEIIAK